MTAAELKTTERTLEAYIYQPYLKNPYLFTEEAVAATKNDALLKYAGHKFDMRINAVITQHCELIIYRKFLTRFSKHRFDMSNYSNEDIHLTNYHVQRKTTVVGWDDPRDAIMRYDTFRQLFGADETDQLNININRIIEAAVSSVVENVTKLDANQHTYGIDPGFFQNSFYSGKAFMFLGVDIIIDEDRKPMLIEINVSPDTNVMEDEFFETAWRLTIGRRMSGVKTSLESMHLSENFYHVKTYATPRGVTPDSIEKQWRANWRKKLEIPRSRANIRTKSTSAPKLASATPRLRKTEFEFP